MAVVAQWTATQLLVTIVIEKNCLSMQCALEIQINFNNTFMKAITIYLIIKGIHCM